MCVQLQLHTSNKRNDVQFVLIIRYALQLAIILWLFCFYEWEMVQV